MYLVTANARLAKHGDRAKGFHAFRRYRITRLREMGCPEDILRFWVGHSAKGITDRYSKLSENAELRKQWAAKCGLGFDVPELFDGNAGHPAPQPTSAQESPSYVATDDDLPIELFAPAIEALAEVE